MNNSYLTLLICQSFYLHPVPPDTQAKGEVLHPLSLQAYYAPWADWLSSPSWFQQKLWTHFYLTRLRKGLQLLSNTNPRGQSCSLLVERTQ